MTSMNILAIFFTSFFLLFATKANSITSFNFTKFTAEPNIVLQGSAKTLPDGVLSLTDIEKSIDLGRAFYKFIVPLWDQTTFQVYSFVTSFSFKIINQPNTAAADGFVFFIGDQINITIPDNSGKGYLGLVNSNSAIQNRFVGVEFDNYPNPWDPSYAHVGVNFDTIYSSTHRKWNFVSGSLLKVDISFDSLSKILTVVTNNDGQILTLAQVVDFKSLLPREAFLGFSAASGDHQSHNIYSWSFKSFLDTTPTSNSNIIKNTIASS